MNESTTWHAETFGRDAHSNHDSEPNSKAPSTAQGTSGSETEKPGSSDVAEHQAPRNYSRWQWACILVAIYSSQFLYGLDTTIVADIQGAVTDDFGEVGLLGWLGTGFPLGSVATILSFGKAYGVFDIKWLYISSMTMFTAGSALCGAAPDMTALIIGRVWAGAGGAGMYLGVLNLIAVNTNTRERPLYIGVSGIVWGAGCILGPVIGGSFADSSATWRWAFYLNLVLFGIFSPILFFILRPYSFQPDVPFTRKLVGLDWVGMILNAALYTVFVMLFTFAGVQWAWDDPSTIILFVMFGVILLSFVASQYFTVLSTKESRIFPADFLRNKTMVLLYIGQACAATTLFVPIYYIPLFFQFVHGDTGVESAVRLLPMICIGVAANMLQGIMMPRFGRYMPWFLAASVFGLIAGCLFYAAINVDTPVSHIYGFSVLLALGAGLSQQAAYSVAPTEVPPHRVPDAVGFINMAQIGSSVIALTITSSIFQNVGFRHVSTALAGLGYSADEMHVALTGQRSAIFAQVSDEVRQQLVKAIVKTVNDEYILVIAAGALGTIVALLMNRGKLNLEVAAGG